MSKELVYHQEPLEYTLFTHVPFLYSFGAAFLYSFGGTVNLDNAPYFQSDFYKNP